MFTQFVLVLLSPLYISLLEVFMTSCDTKRKRARAVVDFERTEEDELGFVKHDVITILSQRDEHCWVGELHGHVGWFPAKFVELIDERSKQYSCAGDDKVNQTITDLVRGPLASGLKQMLEQVMMMMMKMMMMMMMMMMMSRV